jgi:hypothetical protein
MFQKKGLEEIKTHILYSVRVFSLKSCRLIVEKYSKAGRATDDRIAYAHWMLDP